MGRLRITDENGNVIYTNYQESVYADYDNGEEEIFIFMEEELEEIPSPDAE